MDAEVRCNRLLWSYEATRIEAEHDHATWTGADLFGVKRAASCAAAWGVSGEVFNVYFLGRAGWAKGLFKCCSVACIFFELFLRGLVGLDRFRRKV